MSPEVEITGLVISVPPDGFQVNPGVSDAVPEKFQKTSAYLYPLCTGAGSLYDVMLGEVHGVQSGSHVPVSPQGQGVHPPPWHSGSHPVSGLGQSMHARAGPTSA